MRATQQKAFLVEAMKMSTATGFKIYVQTAPILFVF